MIRDAQFVDDTVSGLRFNVTGVGEGVTTDVGKFQFAEGRKIDFLRRQCRQSHRRRQRDARLHRERR